MKTIGLIAAMPQESQALLRLVEGRKRTALRPFAFDRFQVADRDCLLVTSGMGAPRAGQAAHTLLENYAVDRLISFGIAGAVESDLEIGDVISATQTCLLENQELKDFSPLALLPENSWQAVNTALLKRNAHLVTGTVVTTHGSQVLPASTQKLEHPILEMETIGIARAAAEHGIPLVSLRAISDGPRAPIPFDLEAMTDEGYNFRIGKMLTAVLRRPSILFQARNLIRNSRIAADNAAIAVIALLRNS